MKCPYHFTPRNHQWRWIAFRLVQDMNAALAQQRNTLGEGWVAYQVHLQTGNGNNWESPMPQSFTETAQDAPVIDAGEEWAFLIRGRGGRVKQVFVHQKLLLDTSVNS